jgi:hypothetical protein
MLSMATTRKSRGISIASAAFIASAVALTMVVYACTSKKPTQPEAPLVFNDDFNGTSVDGSKWDLSLGDGTAIVSGGKLTLSATTGNFPYLTAKTNPFPAQGDFLLRVGLRYASSPGAGTGIGPDWVNRGGFWVWQDYNGFSTQVGDVPVTLDYHDLTYHVFEWRYVSGTYSLTIDGNSKGTSASSFRPTSLFIGHPPYASSGWTSLEIDFVHIEAL